LLKTLAFFVVLFFALAIFFSLFLAFLKKQHTTRRLSAVKKRESKREIEREREDRSLAALKYQAVRHLGITAAHKISRSIVSTAFPRSFVVVRCRKLYYNSF
jgi:hypothetical protein